MASAAATMITISAGGSLEERVRDLERLLRCKTMEIEILKEALERLGTLGFSLRLNSCCQLIEKSGPPRTSRGRWAK